MVDRKCYHHILWFAVGIGTAEISPTELIGINGTTTGGVFSRPVGSVDSSGWNDAADSFWVSRWWRVMLIGGSNRMLEGEG